MVNRRHIRIKVMQSIYAMHQNGSTDLSKDEKFLFFSIDAILDLYLVVMSSLIEICKKETVYLEKASQKHLATDEERNPNKKFINNAIFRLLEGNNSLNTSFANRKIDNWSRNDDYILILLDAVKQSKWYLEYMNSSENSFEADKELIVNLFHNVIAPNEKLYEYIEDYRLTWVDDIPLVNTEIIRQLKGLKSEADLSLKVPKVFKDEEDRDFAGNLLKKTMLNSSELTKEYMYKSPNWDIDRIAEIDTIILKMAICEFLKFPSIPTKVTMNEYLELAKEYSTPKSSIFINGILDNLLKELHINDRIKKTGRGLM